DREPVAHARERLAQSRERFRVYLLQRPPDYKAMPIVWPAPWNDYHIRVRRRGFHMVVAACLTLPRFDVERRGNMRLRRLARLLFVSNSRGQAAREGRKFFNSRPPVTSRRRRSD